MFLNVKYLKELFLIESVLKQFVLNEFLHHTIEINWIGIKPIGNGFKPWVFKRIGFNPMIYKRIGF